ncbi:MAG: DUF4199 domain-containing protein [Cyclobacteriaceae bacterium]|nr:DUF4199 domain-containing protein [Cyclobacteriaceae bacterium]
MKKNLLIFGLILGAILASHAVYMMHLLMQNPNMVSNDLVGYVAMIVVFSLTFFGIRNYRNKYLNGFISLGQAFKTGALIALIGSTVYVVAGLSYYYLFAPDFLDKYTEHVLAMATRNGATPNQLDAKATELAQFKEMYKNPLFAILISYAEVLPVGLVVAFVSSLFLKRKPATA